MLRIECKQFVHRRCQVAQKNQQPIHSTVCVRAYHHDEIWDLEEMVPHNNNNSISKNGSSRYGEEPDTFRYVRFRPIWDG